eukprot:261785_1
MAFLFKKKPSELCKALLKHIENMNPADEDEQKRLKAQEKIPIIVQQIRVMLYGDEENEPKMANIQKLRDELTNESELLVIILRNLESFSLQTQKEVVKIFAFFLRRGRQNGIVEYIVSHVEIVDLLVTGYQNDKIALHCGPILRECILHKDLCEILLQMTYVEIFAKCVQNPNADAASDAFLTFRALLTKNRSMVFKFFDKHYEDIFDEVFVILLNVDNFVTRKKTLSLLHDILLEKKNQKYLFRYVNDAKHLQRTMKLLRIKSVVMQFAVFDVFKLFIANNNKSEAVSRILFNNRDTLHSFLTKLEKEDDSEFDADKVYLLDQLDKVTCDGSNSQALKSPRSSKSSNKSSPRDKSSGLNSPRTADSSNSNPGTPASQQSEAVTAERQSQPATKASAADNDEKIPETDTQPMDAS